MASNSEPAATNPATSPAFVDSHAHLDEPTFDADRDVTIERARAAGVRRIVNIGYRPPRWESTIALAASTPGMAFTLGVHPQHADELNPETERLLAETLVSAGAAAIGEIGLDFYRDGPSPEQQGDSFRRQLALARSLGMPVVIHQRAAEAELMEILASDGRDLRVILHSFDGTKALADFGRDRGYFFGIGGLMTKARSTALREIVKTLPPDRLLLETDSPYLVPSGIKSRRNEPANIPVIAAKLAELLDLTVDALADRTTLNALQLFYPDSVAQCGVAPTVNGADDDGDSHP